MMAGTITAVGEAALRTAPCAEPPGKNQRMSNSASPTARNGPRITASRPSRALWVREDAQQLHPTGATALERGDVLALVFDEQARHRGDEEQRQADDLGGDHVERQRNQAQLLLHPLDDLIEAAQCQDIGDAGVSWIAPVTWERKVMTSLATSSMLSVVIRAGWRSRPSFGSC